MQGFKPFFGPIKGDNMVALVNSNNKILITGASGQLGIELTAWLRKLFGAENVVATDIRKPGDTSKITPDDACMSKSGAISDTEFGVTSKARSGTAPDRDSVADKPGNTCADAIPAGTKHTESGHPGANAEWNDYENQGVFEYLDVLDKEALADVVVRHQIGTIYHLAAILSAKGEKQIEATWRLNIDGLLNVLESGRNRSVGHIFWPSSIAVFGPDVSGELTPQNAPLNPTTVYGISKVAGEQWCAYYHHRFDVDVRSVRYPGLIGYKSNPGGGTTDYAVEMIRAAITGKTYKCPLQAGTRLPMMYMSDAVKAAVHIMSAEPDRIGIRTSYNVTAMSFSPQELGEVVKNHVNGFKIRYVPDDRDAIATSWPNSIDDKEAQRDWHWVPAYDLQGMVDEILRSISG